jgi:HCOMODA/2-hydroxy-3-carboxy-muconic semialdehyde decarboxylase
MRRHGVAVAGRNLHEVVYRAIGACQNAEFVTAAESQGEVEPLSDGELDAIQPNIPAQSERAWQFWAERLRASQTRI